MWKWNHQMWEKNNKGTTECDKRIVTYDVGTAQYENGIIKYKDLVTWYNRLPTSEYHTLLFGGGGRWNYPFHNYLFWSDEIFTSVGNIPKYLYKNLIGMNSLARDKMYVLLYR